MKPAVADQKQSRRRLLNEVPCCGVAALMRQALHLMCLTISTASVLQSNNLFVRVPGNASARASQVGWEAQRLQGATRTLSRAEGSTASWELASATEAFSFHSEVCQELIFSPQADACLRRSTGSNSSSTVATIASTLAAGCSSSDEETASAAMSRLCGDRRFRMLQKGPGAAG